MTAQPPEAVYRVRCSIGSGSARWTSTKTAPRFAPRPARTSWPALRNLVTTILRLTGATSIAAAQRYQPGGPDALPDDHEVLNDFAGALSPDPGITPPGGHDQA